ncbi:MAG TPA: Fic family protein [Ilumatobacter sp.]|nr:Fic family protein [Ilumatobacter sp.]
MSTRAGRHQRQVTGYRAFVPKSLPPDPPVRWDGDLLRALSAADRALGRLDGLARSLPNPDLFVAMYVRREAVLSSQIEGTQSSLDDVLAFEVAAPGTTQPTDITETVNYVRAMNTGLGLLDSLPLSGRLIRAVHKELLTGVRGQERSPGSFRRTQNWIGPAGCTLQNASFVPPPPDELGDAFAALERFLNDDTHPPLVTAALAHAQFETIHPFLDGNGRVGRLLITLVLVERKVLSRPLLYLSLFLKQNRSEYYDRLGAIRTQGDWEGWLRFFLTGVTVAADDAIEVAGAIADLRDVHLRTVTAENLGRYALPVLDLLVEHPVVTVKYVVEHVGGTPTTIGGLLDKLTSLGVIEETTGQKRNRVYRYSPFLDLFTADDPAPSSLPEEVTS